MRLDWEPRALEDLATTVAWLCLQRRAATHAVICADSCFPKVFDVMVYGYVTVCLLTYVLTWVQVPGLGLSERLQFTLGSR